MKEARTGAWGQSADTGTRAPEQVLRPDSPGQNGVVGCVNKAWLAANSPASLLAVFAGLAGEKTADADVRAEALPPALEAQFLRGVGKRIRDASIGPDGLVPERAEARAKKYEDLARLAGVPLADLEPSRTYHYEKPPHENVDPNLGEKIATGWVDHPRIPRLPDDDMDPDG